MLPFQKKLNAINKSNGIHLKPINTEAEDKTKKILKCNDEFTTKLLKLLINPLAIHSVMITRSIV
jgi:hypothetical protein